jgi:hypothetical protein
MIKIEYIMTKNMVENVLKKNVSLYTNKILLIFILIFTPITIFCCGFFCGTLRIEDILLALFIVISSLLIWTQIVCIIITKKRVKNTFEIVRIMYGDTDEFPEAIVFEEDEWLVEGEKRSLNFKYEDMVKYFFLDNQLCIVTKGNCLVNFPIDPNSEQAKQIEKLLVQKGNAKKIRWFL